MELKRVNHNMELKRVNHNMELKRVPGLKEAVKLAISTGNWKDVVTLLEAAVPKNSVEHKQLMEFELSYKYLNIIKESCLRGYTELVQVFLNTGLPPDYIVDGFGMMLHYAAFGGHLHLVKLLSSTLPGANINSKTHYGKTPLQLAFIQGHFDVVKHLISAGADVNAGAIEGFSLLNPAFYPNVSEEMFQLLLDSGYNITTNSYLYWAVKFKNINCVKELLDAGACVNGTCTDDIPLHQAVLYGSIPMMELLLEYGADVNVTNIHGYAALHYAVLSTRKLPTVKFLIEHGSLVNAVTNDKETPLSLFVRNRESDVAMLLMNSGADVTLDVHRTLLHDATLGAPVEIIECLLEHGADVTTVYHNVTALQYTILYSNYSNDRKLHIVKLLLVYGSNHYVHDDDGNTVLHWVCEMGDVELVEYLIDYGLDVDVYNKSGKKPIDIAHEIGHAEIVNIITEYHCNKYSL